MVSLADLPELIPFLRVEDFVLYPNLKMTVNISDPAVQGMMETVCNTEPHLVGFLQYEETDDHLYDIGCAAQIEEIREYETGHLADVKGFARFRVLEMVSGFQPFARARVKWDEFEIDLKAAEPVKDFDKRQFIERSLRHFERGNGMTDLQEYGQSGEEFLINYVALCCQFSSAEKQALLESKTLFERHSALLALMDMQERAPTQSTRFQ